MKKWAILLDEFCSVCEQTQEIVYVAGKVSVCATCLSDLDRRVHIDSIVKNKIIKPLKQKQKKKKEVKLETPKLKTLKLKSTLLQNAIGLKLETGSIIYYGTPEYRALVKEKIL